MVHLSIHPLSNHTFFINSSRLYRSTHSSVHLSILSLSQDEQINLNPSPNSPISSLPSIYPSVHLSTLPLAFTQSSFDQSNQPAVKLPIYPSIFPSIQPSLAPFLNRHPTIPLFIRQPSNYLSIGPSSHPYYSSLHPLLHFLSILCSLVDPSIHSTIHPTRPFLFFFFFPTDVLFYLAVTGERLSSRSNLSRSLEVRGCDLVIGELFFLSLSLFSHSLSNPLTLIQLVIRPKYRTPFISAASFPGLGSMWECQGASSSQLSTFFLCESCSKVISNRNICQHMSGTQHQFNYMVSRFSRRRLCALYVLLKGKFAR